MGFANCYLLHFVLHVIDILVIGFYDPYLCRLFDFFMSIPRMLFFFAARGNLLYLGGDHF